MSQVLVALTSCPSLEVAQRIATTLVDERLAACVNIVPGVLSVYRWQGQRETAEELLCVMKTTASSLGELTRRLGELHPYESPELVTMEVNAGLPAYLAWIRESVR